MLVQPLMTAFREPDRAINYLLVKSRIRSLQNRLTGAYFDAFHHVTTEGHVSHGQLRSNDQDAVERATEYRPTPLLYLKTAFGNLPFAVEGMHFVDVGCGYGRACFYAISKFGKHLSRVTGIDFDPRLLEVAKSNAASFRGNENLTVELNFLAADARNFKIQPGPTCIFLFNPFDGIILSKFLEFNGDLLKRFPVMVIYINDYHRSVIEEFGFASTYRHRLFRISILTNQAAAELTRSI